MVDPEGYVGFDDGEPSKLGALLDPFEQLAGTPDSSVGDGVLASKVMVHGQSCRHHSRRAGRLCLDRGGRRSCVRR